MSNLVGLDGLPLERQVTRKRMTAGSYKKTPKGDIIFHFVVDVPEGVSEDDANRAIYEYANILVEAYKKKIR